LASRNKFKTPRIIAIIAGIIIFIILMIAFFSFGQVVKGFGNIFLFLPDKLGIIQTTKRAEIAEVYMYDSPTFLNFEKPGLYTVYTVDYDLLIINDELTNHKLDPWLKVTEVASGQPVEIGYVERGMRIYDTPLVQGRPIHTFYIENPGAYEIGHLSKKVSIYFMPDYLTGNEDLIAFSYLSQLAILLVIGGIFYRRKAKERAARIREIKELKNIQKPEGERFWDGYQQDPHDKKRRNYWRK